MSERITFRMAAWTDAAGKYDPNAPLDGNEDNYYADDNLGDSTPSHVVTDEDVLLSECGMIMAVADGMGGMNAGEVASQIAHDTVAEYFAPGRITPELASTHENRCKYMESVVVEADRRIKADAKHNNSHEGMGSTLIMAWLSAGKLSLTWIGDSRAYRFNPATGIEALSKDHSYVQELVDKGVITYEQTFDHPQGNIITRSLGDTAQKARPESRLVHINNDDIILLCSDGLSGVLRDRKTYDENGRLLPGYNLEDIIREHSNSLRECREALWLAAEQSDWYDNVTAVLCQIRSGAGMVNTSVSDEQDYSECQDNEGDMSKTFDGQVIGSRKKRHFLIASAVCVLLACGGIGGCLWKNLCRKTTQLVALPDTLNDTGSDNISDMSDTLSNEGNEPETIPESAVRKKMKEMTHRVNEKHSAHMKKNNADIINGNHEKSFPSGDDGKDRLTLSARGKDNNSAKHKEETGDELHKVGNNQTVDKASDAKFNNGKGE